MDCKGVLGRNLGCQLDFGSFLDKFLISSINFKETPGIRFGNPKNYMENTMYV